MAIRIQLASNFQVVELTYDSWECVDASEVKGATDMVNELGRLVVNDIKTKESPKKAQEESPEDKPASEAQIKFAMNLGLMEEKARKMNSKEIWKWIQKNK